MNFIIYDSEGKILRTGSCPEEDFYNQQQPGEFIIEGIADIAKDAVDPITKQVIAGGKPPDPIDMDYRLARFNAYPSIGEQLDMLWHAMHTNQIPKAEPFYSTLKAVKLSYPSDNSVVPGSEEIFPIGN